MSPSLLGRPPRPCTTMRHRVTSSLLPGVPLGSITASLAEAPGSQEAVLSGTGLAVAGDKDESCLGRNFNQWWC